MAAFVIWKINAIAAMSKVRSFNWKKKSFIFLFIKTKGIFFLLKPSTFDV